MDGADFGLNPLGLAKNAIPFDITASQVVPPQGQEPKTHFEQIWGRAADAMNNAIAVFNYANDFTQMLRRQSDTEAEFNRNVENQEIDFKNRLIETYGYPYYDDIGPGRTYPQDYDGPDLDHYMYSDVSSLLGVAPPKTIAFALQVREQDVSPTGELTTSTRSLTFHLDRDSGFGLVKPESWTDPRGRRAPGEIQRAHGELLQAKGRFERAVKEYDNLMAQIEDQAQLLRAQFRLNAEEVSILSEGITSQSTLNEAIRRSRQRQLDFQTKARQATIVANAVAEALPKSAGFSFDPTSVARSAIMLAGGVISENANRNANRESLVELDHQQAKELAQALNNIRLTTLRQEQGIEQQLRQLEQLVRQEASLRLEIYTLQEAMQQAAGSYRSVLARGERIRAELHRFRQQTAAQITSYRYRDMAFRIFRNETLQKYRAQFDVAARYVYLAAKAYDFETNLRPGDPSRPGRDFLQQIVRARTIGLITGGIPQTGGGLADPMAQMSRNFGTCNSGGLKTQLGFCDPTVSAGEFSLRSEFLRTQPDAAGSTIWREVLSRFRVDDLNEVPEFRQYCLFQASLPREPGLVIPFTTTIDQDLNFFGWPFGGGDSRYDTSWFMHKIRSVGISFSNYRIGSNGLAKTAFVYLIPVGSDMMRSPRRFVGDSINFTREWKILDQWLPVPFRLADRNDPVLAGDGYIPINQTEAASGGFLGQPRGHASFNAWHSALTSDGLNADMPQFQSSQLIGRSVWNTRWLLIIPGVNLLNDREEGIRRFIDSVTDIRIRLKTYAYRGQ